MSDKCLRCLCYLTEHCYIDDIKQCIKCKNYIPAWHPLYNLAITLQDLYNIAKKKFDYETI